MEHWHRRHVLSPWVMVILMLLAAVAGSVVASAESLAPNGRETPTAYQKPPDADPAKRPVRLTGWLTHDPKTGWHIGPHPIAGSWPELLERYVALTGVMGSEGTLAPLGEVRVLNGTVIEFRGPIQEMQPRFWRIHGFTVFVDDRTVVTGRPAVGELAVVKGIRIVGDSLLATLVAIVGPFDYATVEFEGPLDDMIANDWVVGGVPVAIGAVTALEGLPPMGLEPGPETIVQVRGVQQPNGVILAEYVFIQSAAAAVTLNIEGLVERIETGRWVIGGQSVAIDARTLVDDGRAPAEIGVWAKARLSAETLTALRIRLSRP